MKKLKKKNSTYVLFGFCKSDEDDVGFLFKVPSNDEDEVITDDMVNAMRFTDENVDSAVKFINEEFKDIYGPHAYVFHKVKVIS